jgi:hypothetical protein
MYRKFSYLVSFVFVLPLVFTNFTQANLIGYWKLDEVSGTIAADSSDGGNDGTIEGTPGWVTGWLGGALEFDGSLFVTLPADNMGLSSDTGSVAFWMNMAELSGGINTIWWGGDNTTGGGMGPENEMHIHIESTVADVWEGGELCFRVLHGPIVHLHSDPEKGDASVPGNPPVNPVLMNDGQWHHVACTWGDADGNVNLYLDSSLLQQAAYTTPSYPLTNIYLGQMADGGRTYTGLLDDVRIYNRALLEVEIPGVMAGGGTTYPQASGPDPKDGSLHPDTWANVSWSTGDYAVSHDVYFGDNFDAVNEGAEDTFIGNQTDTFIVVGFPGFPMPDGLVPGTTYYWRIDEVNEAEPNSPWKGDVWSFSVPPKTAYFPEPADEAEGVSIDARLSWTPGFSAKLHTVYFGETFEEVDNATGGSPLGNATYSPGTLKMAKTYYWRVDEFDIVETHKGNVWSFTTEGAVSSPNPAKGTVDITQTPVLTWTPGLGATHEIYFGTDASALELKNSGSLGSESYETGQIEWNTTYYWRVDEVNNANADSPWTGPTWSFTTADFLIIDDMESYNDLNPDDPDSNRIFNAWIDGFEDPTNGSLVGNENPPFAEQTIVHTGNQSMPVYYDNSVGKSEATLTLTSNRDWTVKGVDTLTIWFRGGTGNAAETLYVTLNSTARVDHDNPDAATVTSWTEWNISLQAFADQGVNLANVNSITLGLGSVTGGTGIMYFDDVRLYSPTP